MNIYHSSTNVSGLLLLWNFPLKNFKSSWSQNYKFIGIKEYTSYLTSKMSRMNVISWKLYVIFSVGINAWHIWCPLFLKLSGNCCFASSCITQSKKVALHWNTMSNSTIIDTCFFDLSWYFLTLKWRSTFKKIQTSSYLMKGR